MSKKSKTEMTLQNYVNDAFGKIRGMFINGEAWVVAVDVCKALEIGNTSQALARLKSNEKMTINSNEGHSGKRGGAQKLNLVNEPGLYRLIFTSRKPEADNFQNWVYHDVLPSIRKTGSYILDKDLKELIEARLDGKQMRKAETGTIKHFIDYARAQGCIEKERYFYSKLSILCNLGVGLPHKNGRNSATKEQLIALGTLEGVTVKNVLLRGMADGLHWTRIWAQVQQQIQIYTNVVFQGYILPLTEVAALN